MPKEFPGASYDHWKTTDPRDYEPEEPKPERDPDQAYDEWRDRKMEDINLPFSGSEPPDDEPDPSTIICEHNPPPIPMRCFDWCARRADYEPPMPLGFGATKEEAIADLLEKEGEEDE